MLTVFGRAVWFKSTASHSRVVSPGLPAAQGRGHSACDGDHTALKGCDLTHCAPQLLNVTPEKRHLSFHISEIIIVAAEQLMLQCLARRQSLERAVTVGAYLVSNQQLKCTGIKSYSVSFWILDSDLMILVNITGCLMGSDTIHHPVSLSVKH